MLVKHCLIHCLVENLVYLLRHCGVHGVTANKWFCSGNIGIAANKTSQTVLHNSRSH